MKVVSCKNCGAKYQLDDTDDISTYECSSCAGDLEVIESYPNDTTTQSTLYSQNVDDSFITQCENCGLKYRINNDENILDYECESCGGSLRYMDENLNKELDAYIKEHGHQRIKVVKNEEEIKQNEKFDQKAVETIKSLPDRLETFFSEDQIYELAEENNQEQEPVQTARTKVPKSVLSRFEKEFNIPKSNDYNTMKKFLKKEFYKSMEEYYEDLDNEEPPTGSLSKLSKKLSIKEPNSNNESSLKIQDSEKNKNYITMTIGAILFVGGTIEIFAINSGYGIISLIVGVIILCIGIYKTKDFEDSEKRSKVIRERLLTLPEEYYVLYNVKVPRATAGINHLVIGPSGIYGIITQKYNPKVKLESDNENKNLINSQNEDDEKVISSENSESEFKYTTKQEKFPHDNKVKQKALKLGENLINFLNANDIKNCFVEPLVGFVNEDVVVINTPLTDEDLFIDELLHRIEFGPIKLDSAAIDKCAVLLNKYSADCSTEI